MSHDAEFEATQTSINTRRRFYLRKRLAARIARDHGLEAVFRYKQEAETGTSLADDFPARAELVAAGYSTTEDLDGADTDELVAAGIPYNLAAAAIAALE